MSSASPTGIVFGISRGALSGWNDAMVVAAFAAGVCFLPAFLAIERRSRSPLLDLSLFADRVFSAAGASQFLNSLGRSALTFLFVFYFQGPQEQSPIMAGLELAPMAAGMLLASPLAGRYADRHGARGLASFGLLVSAAGTAGMTMLQAHSAYWLTAVWLAVTGVGSGMFMSPNGSAMMGAAPPHRRGIAAGARIMLLNTGSVVSIAFLLAIITQSLPKSVLFRIFSGLTSGLPAQSLDPFIANMHIALWALTGVSVLGAVVSAMRPKHVLSPADTVDATA
jgi:MFS family permease